MIDIRLYSIIGYNKKVDDFTTQAMKDFVPEMDMKFLRDYRYSDEQKKKLDDFDILAKQMVGRRFGFFCDNGTILSGKVVDFSWDKYRLTMKIHLQLDVEPDASIKYSVNIHSGLSVDGDVVILSNDVECHPYLIGDIPADSLKVEL